MPLFMLADAERYADAAALLLSSCCVSGFHMLRATLTVACYYVASATYATRVDTMMFRAAMLLADYYMLLSTPIFRCHADADADTTLPAGARCRQQRMKIRYAA